MVLSLDCLPEELLYTILCNCSPCSSVALGQTCRKFQNITNEPLLWRFYCQTYFKFWDPKHDIATSYRSSASEVDWKALYISRHLIDQRTCQLLNSILARQTGRIKKFRTIIGLGYDIKDTLLRHISAGSDTEDYLARRWRSH